MTVILDLYGVLLKEHAPTLQAFVKETKSAEMAQVVDSYYEKAAHGLMDGTALMRECGYIFPQSAAEYYATERVTLDTDFFRFAKHCEKEGVSLWLAGNGVKDMVDHLCRHRGLDKIFAGTAVSSELKAWTPEDAFYRAMRVKMGICADDCIMVDDDPGNSPTAAHFGYKTILFRREGDVPGAVNSFGELSLALFGEKENWVKRPYRG